MTPDLLRPFEEMLNRRIAGSSRARAMLAALAGRSMELRFAATPLRIRLARVVRHAHHAARGRRTGGRRHRGHAALLPAPRHGRRGEVHPRGRHGRPRRRRDRGGLPPAARGRAARLRGRTVALHRRRRRALPRGLCARCGGVRAARRRHARAQHRRVPDRGEPRPAGALESRVPQTWTGCARPDRRIEHPLSSSLAPASPSAGA